MRCDITMNKEEAVAIYLPAFECVLSGQHKRAFTSSNLNRFKVGGYDTRELLKDGTSD